jgi:hypothetical protein
MENSEFLEMLNDIEKEKEKEKSILIVEYRNTPQELLNKIDELSNWIVERNDCNWCTLDGCIHFDYENINDFFQIILSHNILKPLTELYRVDDNRQSIEFFVRIINNTIKQNENSEHKFLQHFSNYGIPFVKKISNRFNLGIEEIKRKDEVLKTENTDLPEIELKTQQEQIRLLYDLGIINYLQKEFKATLKGNNNQTALLISQILKLKHGSVQPTLNALLSNNVNKNYPTETTRTKAIINQLNANELK